MAEHCELPSRREPTHIELALGEGAQTVASLEEGSIAEHVKKGCHDAKLAEGLDCVSTPPESARGCNEALDHATRRLDRHQRRS